MKLPLLPLLLALVSVASAAEDASVLDGVYSKAQAQRGKNVYNRQCVNCHSSNLQGEGIEPPLIGVLFIDAWREDKLFSLYDYMATRMPKEGRRTVPGSLTEQQYLDLLAYMLERNGYPAGTADLRAEQLTTTQFVGLQGPAPLPPSAMARVVGCLQDGANGLQLEQATPAIRVRVIDETDEHEVGQSKASALGSEQVRLTNVAELGLATDTLFGQKVQAKGVLNLENGAFRLHILSLVTTGVACTPGS